MAIKSRSVDVTMDPSDVFKQEIKVLNERDFEIIQTIRLEPYEKDHAMILARRQELVVFLSRK